MANVAVAAALIGLMTPFRAALLGTFLLIAGMAFWPLTSTSQDRAFTVNGIVDCGRRDGQACRLGELLTLITDDLGGAPITIDITWIKDTLPSLDQGDPICIEVAGSGGSYQATGVVPCASPDKVKRVKEKDDPTATPTLAPSVTPTNTPEPTATSSPEPTATGTPQPTSTASPTSTPTNTPTATPTQTPNTRIRIAATPGPYPEFFNGNTAFFAVTLTNAINAPVTVDYDTEDGTANGTVVCDHQALTGTRDYQTESGSLTFNPLETIIVIDVEICGDFVFESRLESFNVVLSNPSANAIIEIPSATAEIEDLDEEF